MGKGEDEKVLSDEEDSSFERIEEDRQLETSSSEAEEEKEEESFEVVQDELVQARAQIERLKKERKKQDVLLYLCGGILLAIIMHGPPAPPPAPTCPAAPECPVHAPPECPPDGYAPRQISFDWGLGRKDLRFQYEDSFITWVDHNSRAAAAGLRVGDEIVAVGDYVVISADSHTISQKLFKFDYTVRLTVRTNAHAATKQWWAKKRAHEEGVRVGKEEGWHEGWRHTAPFFVCAGAAVALFIVFEIRENSSAETDKKEKKGAAEVKKAVRADVDSSESEDEEEEEETNEEKKALEMEEIIERACKVIRAELNAAKDKTEEPMKSSANVDELMRGWLENTLDENLKRNDNLVNL